MTRLRSPFHTPLLLISVSLAMAACSSSNSKESTDGGDTDAASLGPGASLKCTSSGKNAWETYGADAFVAVNQSIFSTVTTQLGTDAGSTGLGKSFSMVGTGGRDDITTFEGKLAAFLVYAYGGPTSIMYTDGKMYDGVQDMVTAHTGLAITSDEYTYFVTNVVVAALTANKVPMGDISSCFAPIVNAPSFISQIVGH
jgi:hypothetical protein